MKNKNSSIGDLPLDAHPGAIKGGDNPLLTPAKRASESLWDSWAKLRDTEKSVTDKSKLAPIAQKVVEKALATTDKALDSLRKNRELLTAKVNSVVSPKTGDPLGAEIRSHIKAQKSAFIFLAAAVKSGDKRTLAAALNAPAYLSGLTTEQCSSLLALAQKTFCPEEVLLIENIDKAAARLSRTAEHISTTIAGRIRTWSNAADDDALKGLKNA